MPTPTLATAARRLARAGATTRATRGAHALALRAARVESSARANDALVARDEDVATLTLRARPDARPSAAGLLATLRPRDWALLEHASSRASFASAPSALVRRANGAMVVRMGPTTTLVGPKCAYVFEPATRVAKNIVDTLRTWVGERDAAEGSAGAEARTVKDFPLAALECALEASSRYFEEKIFRLRRLARHCVDEISSDLRGDGKSGIVTGGSLNYNAAQWQKLPPIRRAIKEFEQDAREASEALNAAMTTTNLVPTPMDVVFDEKAAEERNDAVTDVLASHARRLAAVGGLVRELSADLDSARELWELQLDGDRNRTVQMNFRASCLRPLRRRSRGAGGSRRHEYAARLGNRADWSILERRWRYPHRFHCGLVRVHAQIPQGRRAHERARGRASVDAVYSRESRFARRRLFRRRRILGDSRGASRRHAHRSRERRGAERDGSI